MLELGVVVCEASGCASTLGDTCSMGVVAVVAVVGVVGVVYEQEMQVVRGCWSWMDASAAGAPRPAPRPQPSAPPAPCDIGAGLAAIDDIHVAGDKVDTTGIRKARVCRKGASFSCVDSNMSAAKNIVKALEPFTR